MHKKDFIRLLAKHQKGQCTEAEINLINRWYDQLGMEQLPFLTDEEQQALKAKLWQQIDIETVEDTENLAIPERKLIPLRTYRWWAAAAAIVLLIGLQFLFVDRTQPRQLEAIPEIVSIESDFIDQTNTTNQPQRVSLEDGSIVYLQPHSTIRYTSVAHSHKREVWLKGTAFFEVKKDVKRPFLVYSNELVTRVLGTSFWVAAPDNTKQIEITVHSGKVAVYKRDQPKTSQPANPEVVLTPNQKLTFFVDQNRLTTSLIDQPEPIQTPTEPESVTFVFNDSPLPEVLKQLQNSYGIEMVLGDQQLANCRFTGKIDKQPLYKKLELICKSINAEYEVQETRILFNGQGCDSQDNRL